jgi:two-component system, OmpR family, sensor histidine kinase KdpD
MPEEPPSDLPGDDTAPYLDAKPPHAAPSPKPRAELPQEGEFDEHVAKKRGKLKIFLGAAPGVGKTFTMLAEARRRYARGEDLVVGFVETHGRAETARQLEGLEVVPRQKLEYRGTTFEEMDVDQVLARHAEWVLVDELAHTNVPGSRNAKRWQDVQEFIEAGINVISTVNVQHFESLNDTVFDITGVRVRETLPDWMLDEADEVVFIDVTPEALINRLKRGDIYKLEKVPQALKSFFRKGNLSALRELALRRTADEVDEQLLEYMKDQKIERGWATQERVLVCLSPRLALSAKLVRRGYRVARQFKSEFQCVFVRTPGASLPPEQEETLEKIYGLARNLGGQVHELEGESVATEIIAFALEHQVTLIVMGQSARSRVREILSGSIVARIMRESANIDIFVVADPEKQAPIQ